jgi:hypothetical protein
MGRTTNETGLLAGTVRLSPAEFGFIEKLGKDMNESFNGVVRHLINDARTYFGLPEAMTNLLDDEAKKLNKNRREYVLHLLSSRAVELIKAEGRAESGGKRK